MLYAVFGGMLLLIIVECVSIVRQNSRITEYQAQLDDLAGKHHSPQARLDWLEARLNAVKSPAPPTEVLPVVSGPVRPAVPARPKPSRPQTQPVPTQPVSAVIDAEHRKLVEVNGETREERVIAGTTFQFRRPQ